MRLNYILRRQHVGFYFDLHWYVKGKRIVLSTGAEEELRNKNIPFCKAEDLFKTKQEHKLIEEEPNYIPRPIKFDHTHPNWHDRICYTYKDSNLLLEGLEQAKIVTNTVEVQKGLPDEFTNKESPVSNKKVRDAILNSTLFDAEQKLLPKINDPLRPAWNFPRVYGITSVRVHKLLITRLLQLIEFENDKNIAKNRNLINSLQFCDTFEKYNDLFQIDVKGEILLTANTPLRPVTNQLAGDINLPDLYPIKPTITFNRDKIYKIYTKYPVNQASNTHHPHTLFIHFDNQEVKNLYEDEVTESQIEGRSLMKTFAAASSYAKKLYGENAQVLPKPVTLQCVHSDARMFHFGILQLNTLDLEDGKVKNIWYQNSRAPLFTNCSYLSGKPILEGYNNKIIQTLNAFYTNI